jgi:hypothetical protein
MEPAIGRWLQHFLTALAPLEVLNGAFVFLRRGLCIERAEISSFARLRIFLAGIQPVLTGFQFSDHDSIEYSQIKWTTRVELQGNRFGSPILDNPPSIWPTRAWANGSKPKAPPAQRESRGWSPGD